MHTDLYLDTVDYDSKKLFKVNNRLKKISKFLVPSESSMNYFNSFNFFNFLRKTHSAAAFELSLESTLYETPLALAESRFFSEFFKKKFFYSGLKSKDQNTNFGVFFLNIFSSAKNNLVNYSNSKFDAFETNRFHKRISVSRQPIVVSKAFLDLEKSAAWENKDYRVVNVFFNKEKSFVKKVPNEQSFLVLKQKRYKRKKVIPQRVRFFKNLEDLKIEKIKFADKPYFVSTNFLDSLKFEPTKLYRLLKKNKIRHENMPVQLSRRLLRTKKTLVLPAHVNLTVVTNSYDVVHSWFIPALGVKLDCVPGRSTHHVFYCDNIGFYYGQCAEICGRYHHHMPVRICALPFEHFVIWWQHFGLGKTLFSFNKKKFELKFINKTFSW